MRLVYCLFMYLLTPYLLVRLWWKGLSLPAYHKRIRERFGFLNTPLEVDVWLHAVSLGEVIAATPLIDGLLEKQKTIFITTMTPTGSERVQSRFGSQVSHQYIPYDLPIALRLFFKALKPKVGIIMETELWPNLIYYATKSGIPLMLVNARLSERSYLGYRKVQFLFQPLLKKFHKIFAQADEDAERFKLLGADANRVEMLGNMKFDLQTQLVNQLSFIELKKQWGPERPVFIVASTHDNEEELILAELKRLQAAIPQVILLIAPRHPERFQTVYQLSKRLKFKTALRSEPQTLNTDIEVVLLDSLGELMGFYSISDYAFVGGSLVPVGGHNVLEPIAMNVPVFSGTKVCNFKTICRDLEQAKGIELVENAAELINQVINVHHDVERRTSLVTSASQVLEANKGTVARYISKIESVL